MRQIAPLRPRRGKEAQKFADDHFVYDNFAMIPTMRSSIHELSRSAMRTPAESTGSGAPRRATSPAQGAAK